MAAKKASPRRAAKAATPGKKVGLTAEERAAMKEYVAEMKAGKNDESSVLAKIAAMQGKDLNLSLGFSHPVLFPAPEGITITTPTQTEILVSGADKQRVGEVAAKIRGFRPPEPYKGKGVKYAGENIIRKEAKKA